MEDAHISNLKFNDNQALFGVFDGHGGREVAHYTKSYLEACIKDLKEFKEKEYPEALRKGFLQVD